MAVYMIRAGQTGPVKIGHSADPVIRLLQLQVGHYEELRIIRLFHGDEPQERFVQAQFSDNEIRGEWYAFSKKMLGDVGLEELPISTPVLPTAAEILSFPIGKRIVQARKVAGLTQRRLAELCNCAPSAVAQWEIGSTTVSMTRLPSVAQALGVKMSWLLSSDAA